MLCLFAARAPCCHASAPLTVCLCWPARVGATGLPADAAGDHIFRVFFVVCRLSALLPLLSFPCRPPWAFGTRGMHAADFLRAHRCLFLSPLPSRQGGYPAPGQVTEYITEIVQCNCLLAAQWAKWLYACGRVTDADHFMKMLAQGGYPQPGAMPAGYPPYPYPMMPGYAPAAAPTGKAGKAVAGAEPAAKGRKRRKRIPQGGPKKPATSFVLFSNTVREQVKEENPGLSFLDLGKKLGEMWREMDPNVRCSFFAHMSPILTLHFLPRSCRFSRSEGTLAAPNGGLFRSQGALHRHLTPAHCAPHTCSLLIVVPAISHDALCSSVHSLIQACMSATSLCWQSRQLLEGNLVPARAGAAAVMEGVAVVRGFLSAERSDGV